MSVVVESLGGRRLCRALAVFAALLVVLVLSLDGRSARAAGGSPPPISNAPALLPTPTCPTPPASEMAPWKDPSFGADCQVQFVIEDLENPASPLYQQVNGTPTQSTLQRLEAAIATGSNIVAANGTNTTLLALYGLTTTGGGGDGATGLRPSGLAFPSALALGATWDTAAASAYGTMFGQEFHRAGRSSTLAPVIDIDRTWHTGRENENFGEDPFLTGSMVAPEIRAIQGQGVMTTVKHCCAYTQEQGRSGQALGLNSTPILNTGENELISERGLEEIYGPTWQAAVAPNQGDAMSVMCAYAIVNGPTAPPFTGADSCGNKFILNDLLKRQYGFQGTFTPDAVTAKRDSDILNFENGGDGGDARLTLAALQSIVGDGSGDGQTNADGTQNIISQARLVDEVRRLVLQSTKNERFLNPPTNAGIADGVTKDEATSARIEEGGAVLLKDQDGVLPVGKNARSIAVIGTQAGPNTNAAVGPVSTEQPQVDNDGSPFVDPTNQFTDPTTGQTFGYTSALSGILARAGQAGQTVTYSPGSVGLTEQPAFSANGSTSGPSSIVTPDHSQSGFLATYFGGDDPTDPAATVLGTQVVPSIQYTSTGGPTGPTSIPAVPNGSAAVAIPTQFQFNNWSASYQGIYTPPTTGNYNFSVTESGTVKLFVDGKLVEQRLRDDFGTIDHVTVRLHAGEPASIVLDYSPEEAAASNNANNPFGGFNLFLGDAVHLGAALPPTTGPSLIDRAAAAAKHASVAIVVAGREVGEGHDIENLSLPGDQNELIEAVANANPHTVVVLTGGPVAMPWLNNVDGVLEMWEPGATFGTALASLVYGDSDPSGKLPITFPAGPNQGPGAIPVEYPGLTNPATGASNDYLQLEQENYNEGIDAGYRYYQTHGETPLFPFGYGLSYATFKQQIVRTDVQSDGTVRVLVKDTNEGKVAGADVIEGYVHDPSFTGEPPEQLRAFTKVTLAPGQSTEVTLTFRPSSFAYWNSGPATGTTPATTSPSTPGVDNSTQPGGEWTVAPGQYTVNVGGSSSQFQDSTTFSLSGQVAPGELNGLFGWTLR